MGVLARHTLELQTSEAQAWLDCALPGPADAGVCPTCMDETDAYNACTIGR